MKTVVHTPMYARFRRRPMRSRPSAPGSSRLSAVERAARSTTWISKFMTGTANSLYRLGLLYSDIGDYARSEPLYQRALKIQERVFGPEHHSTTNTISGLGILYYRIGDYARAEPLYHRALEIRE